VRARDAAQARERLEREVLAARCFEGMPADALRRVEAIAGDVTEPSCGVAREIASGFSSAPLHVIHCAASIEFDLPAAEAARINVRGALHVADLARSIASLRSLVSVSTAYVTPARDGAIEEKIAPLPRPADEILEAIERGTVEDAALLAETGHPNSYTLTKCIAEHLLVARASDLPLTLVRPSIIAASWREPFAGWIDSHGSSTRRSSRGAKARPHESVTRSRASRRAPPSRIAAVRSKPVSADIRSAPVRVSNGSPSRGARAGWPSGAGIGFPRRRPAPGTPSRATGACAGCSGSSRRGSAA
jgi:nucleoside-diphosphate-sugar epimerase